MVNFSKGDAIKKIIIHKEELGRDLNKYNIFTKEICLFQNNLALPNVKCDQTTACYHHKIVKTGSVNHNIHHSYPHRI